MRTIAFALAFSAASLAAAAEDDVMANYYGNTLIGRGGQGEWHIWYKADHTYEATLRGRKSSGTFSMWGSRKVCLTQKDPVPSPNHSSACYPVKPRQIGDTWNEDGPNGTTIRMSLVAGHV